ncbi:hypothetical protein [Halomarina oriensis]|uniref:Uncharacterized protein n=1 Tax=Halomarina oriensis TaxID=671145 RepID=A0A6B0GP19_9EURY|nr:hypothetical protein [Halomarina oriensis]MWG33348.1 hypothetical protein [Halomarina oriensis]
MSRRTTSLRLSFVLVLVVSLAATGLGAGVAAADVDDRYKTSLVVDDATANASTDAVTYTYNNSTDTATIDASGDDVVYRTSVKVDDRVFETRNAPESQLREAGLSAVETPLLGAEADTDVLDVQYDDGVVTVTNASSAMDVVVSAVDSTQVAPGLDATVLCADTADDVARFQVSNDNTENVSVEYFVEETGASGTVNLSAEDSTTLDLATTYRGDATLELSADGMVVETADAATATETCDLDEEFNYMNTYQYDLVFGEPIEDIGANDSAFYNADGRLVQATSIMANGDVFASYEVPSDGNATATYDGATITYDAIEYDARNDTATVTVTLDADATNDTTVSLVSYQLPDDTTSFERPVADEQMYVDGQTVTISPGETVTLELTVPQ